MSSSTSNSSSSGGSGDKTVNKKNDISGSTFYQDAVNYSAANALKAGASDALAAAKGQTTPTGGTSSSLEGANGSNGNPAANAAPVTPATPIQTGNGIDPITGIERPDAGDGSSGGGRTDSSVILAGQVGLRKSKNPATSNNFVSVVGAAGGLGRRTGASKRTLIGGV